MTGLLRKAPLDFLGNLRPSFLIAFRFVLREYQVCSSMCLQWPRHSSLSLCWASASSSWESAQEPLEWFSQGPFQAHTGSCSSIFLEAFTPLMGSSYSPPWLLPDWTGQKPWKKVMFVQDLMCQGVLERFRQWAKSLGLSYDRSKQMKRPTNYKLVREGLVFIACSMAQLWLVFI